MLTRLRSSRPNKGYKASKEYALKQAREIRNERSTSDSPGGDKAAGGLPLDRLDHLNGTEEPWTEDYDTLAALNKGKGKGKGFNG